MDHGWSYNYVHYHTHGFRASRKLTVLDENFWEYQCIDMEKRLSSKRVLELLSDLFVRRGVSDHIRSEIGTEFTTEWIRDWLSGRKKKTCLLNQAILEKTVTSNPSTKS